MTRGMMRKWIVGTGLLAAAGAWAGPPGNQVLEALLAQTERPTMEQIDALAAAFHPDRPVPSAQWPGRHLDEEKMLEKLSYAIAAFERAFPGATFYELGRDAVFIGDALDAFYRALGQRDRVRRLDASNPSFRDNDDRITNDFLVASGIDVTRIGDGPAHVVFDTTSFSHTSGVGGGASQSVRIIRAGYRAFVEAGGDPRRLVDKFNFISIGGMWDAREMFGANFSLEKFLDEQRATASERGFQRPLFLGLSEFTYTPEWHGIFDLFRRAPNGTVFAPHGPMSSLETRRSIIAEQWETRRIMSSPEFLAAVERHALLLGYEFPGERTMHLKAATPEAVARVRAEMEKHRRELEERRLAKIRDALRQKREARNAKNKLSGPGIEYLDRLEERILAAGEKTEARLAAMAFALEDLPTVGFLDDNDLVAILKTMLAATYVYENKALVAALVEVARKSPRIAHLLLTAEFKADPYGENDWRVPETRKAVVETLKGVAQTPEPPEKRNGDDDYDCVDWIVEG